MNVTRNWRELSEPAEKIETVERAWPTRSEADKESMYSQKEDLLVAVARGKIVAIRKIDSVTPDEKEPSRFVFSTRESEETRQLIGAQSPVRWGRGEQWPVKFAKREELISMLKPLPTTTLGKFTVSLTADGALKVTCPPGQEVIVISG